MATVGAILAVVVVLLGGSFVLAQQATIDGGTWKFDTGSSGNTVEIKFSGLPSEGLGAADISVAFDSAVLNITACDSGNLDGACNPNPLGGPARAAGFKAPAITSEPVVIATLTLNCVGAGGTSSDLTITVNDLVDGTVGDPQDISTTIQNGTVVCGEAGTPGPTVTVIPTGGSAPPVADSSGANVGWIIALTATLAVASLGVAGFVAMRLRRRV